MTEPLIKFPAPYFGGKSKVAPLVWQVLGDCEHYLEPFLGSGAVLLARPNYDPQRHTESVCDADGYISNIFRSLKFSPDKTAEWCDWPVNHADLIARKARLIREENYLLENLCRDDKWHDPELAGYWIWAASCWIGSGLTRPGAIPHLSDKGKGVHAASQRPHLSDKGKGINATSNNNIYDWFDALSDRLRHVRVVCGDWSRICGGDWQDHSWNTVGMFFDPPYGVEDRDKGIYHKESATVSHDVRRWAIERGKRKNYRIVVAGYDTEHQELEEHGWTVKEWKAQGGYSSTARNGKNTRGKDNSKRERLWFSPACVPQQEQLKILRASKKKNNLEEL